jgi:nicotinamidase-related amidase
MPRGGIWPKESEVSDWAEATGLLVVDMQRTFEDEEVWGVRNNPGSEMNIGALLDAWREQSWPVIYTRTDIHDPDSPLHPGTWGNALAPVLGEDPDLLVVKSSQSAFYGNPDLHGWLHGNGITSLAICGAPIHLSVAATARTAKDLGYEVLYVSDASHTFDLGGSDGNVITASQVAVTFALTLQAAGCSVLYTSELVG